MPSFLAQSRDEVQPRLPVLHVVLAGRVVEEAFEGVGIAGEVLLFEDLLDDLKHAQVLEDAVVRGQAEEPQAGHEGGAVVGAGVGGVQLHEAADDAVHMPHSAAFVRDAQARGPAQNFAEIKIVGLMDQFDFELVGFMNLLMAGKGVDPETLHPGCIEGEPRAVCCRLPH